LRGDVLILGLYRALRGTRKRFLKSPAGKTGRRLGGFGMDERRGKATNLIFY
jgi:hypothetical protein